MSEASLLLQAQRGFAAALRSRARQGQVLSLLDGDAVRNQELLAVYRGNAVANAAKALQLTYPVISKIVGEEFFAGLSRAFWAVSPSASGDLNEYGGDFAAFIEGFPHVASLPYLADVARLEWLVSRAAQAADHAPCLLAQLAEVNPEQMGDLRFGLQPALVIFASRWPLASIWQQHQPDYIGDININLENAECMAVHRNGLRVDVATLGAVEVAFWREAQAGSTLTAMLEAAFAGDDNFDVQLVLQTGFSREFVIALVG